MFIRLCPAVAMALAMVVAAPAQAYLDKAEMIAAYELSGLGVLETGEGTAPDLGWEVPLLNDAGELVGSIKRGEHAGGSPSIELVFKGKTTTLERGLDFPEVRYEGCALTWSKRENGKIKILSKRYPNGFWLQESALPKGHKILTWAQFLARGGLWQSFNAFRVREKPSSKAGVILKLREQEYWPGLSHAVEPTGRVEGNWVAVQVRTFRGSHGCEGTDGKQIGKLRRGWVKAQGDDGLPNFWLHTRGC